MPLDAATDLVDLVETNMATTVGYLIGLAAIVVAIVLYVRGRRVKDPCWDIWNVRLIEEYKSALADLQVTYRDSLVDTLSVARIVFWNRGQETILGSDIASAAPLRVAASEGAVILDAKVVATNNAPSVPTIEVADDQRSALIGFDYLDKENGAVFQIVHTGRSGGDLEVRGTIKGARSIRQKELSSGRYLILPTPRSFDRRLPRRVIFIVNVGALGVAGTALVVFAAFAALKASSIGEWVLFGPVVVYGFILIWFGVLIIRRAIPPGLDAVRDNPLKDDS